MKLLLIGPQGSGKGTVGGLLSANLSIPLIGGGDLLREISPQNPHYNEIHALMDKGELVDQSFVAKLIINRLKESDCNEGYIIDGWGRNMLDLQYFAPTYDFVVYLNISKDLALKRIFGRRMCDSDGKIYNLYTMPEHLLKNCTGNLVKRLDDNEEAILERLAIFYTETAKVIDFYRKKGILLDVDASGTPQEVLELILSKINNDCKN